MRSGSLRHKVELQAAETTRDNYGGTEKSWVTYVYAWASIEPLRGNQALIAQQVKATLSHRINVRYNGDLTVRDRIKHGSRIFEIGQVRNVKERDREIELLCSEVV